MSLAAHHDKPSPRPGEGRRFLKTLGKALRGVLCATLLVLAIGITFENVIELGPANVRGMYDVSRYFVPLAFYTDHALHQGEFPLWNPLVFCGTPHAANPQASACYPPNLIRGLLNAPPTPSKTQASFIVMLGVHFLFMGLCTYLLARSHGVSRAGAYAAALAFILSALMVRRACAFHFITTLAWLPLLLLLAKKTMDTHEFRHKICFACLAGIVLGLSILGGFIQVLPYVAVLATAYCIAYRVLHPKAGAQNGQGWIRLWAKDATALTLIPVAGLMIAAVLLLPLAEYTTFTARQESDVLGLYANLWRSPATDIYRDLILYPGLKFRPEALRGSGVGALLLSLAALSHRRWRRTLLFLVPYLLLLDCCLGPPMPLSRLVEWVTPFSMSAYTRAYDVALLPLSLLAGIGVDAVSARVRTHRRKVLRSLFLVLLGLGTLLPLTHWLVQKQPFLPVSPRLAVGLPVLTFVFMLLLGYLPFPRFLRLVLPVLIFAEILAWNFHFVPRLVDGRVEAAEALQQEQTFPQDNTRGADPAPMRQLRQLQTNMNGYDPLYIDRVRRVICGLGSHERYVRAIQDWESVTENQRGNLFLKRLFWLSSRWVKGPLPPKPQTFSSATTVFLADGENLHVPELERDALAPWIISGKPIRKKLTGAKFFGVWLKAGRWHTLFLDSYTPEAVNGLPVGPAGSLHSVFQLYYQSTCAVEIKTVFRDSLSGRVAKGRKFRLQPTAGETAGIAIPAPDFRQGRATFTITPTGRAGAFRFTTGYIAADRRDEDGRIEIIARRVNGVELEVRDLPDYRILTFVDAAYPGWQAYVDSQPVPIFLANDAFKAIEVPPGTHHVRFDFAPRSFRYGAMLSLAAAAIVSILLGPLWSKGRTRILAAVPNSAAGGPPAQTPQPAQVSESSSSQPR